MIDYATYCQIRSLRQAEKLKVGQIAGQLKLDKKTVRYWLQHDYHPAQRPILTTNQAYKHWLRIFNNDATITSAVLDRVLHHAETVVIEGKSYRLKDQIEDP